MQHIDVKSQAGNYLTSMYPVHFISDQVVSKQRNAYDDPIKIHLYFFISKSTGKFSKVPARKWSSFPAYRQVNKIK